MKEDSILLQNTRKRNWAIFRLRGLRYNILSLTYALRELRPKEGTVPNEWHQLHDELYKAIGHVDTATTLLIQLTPPKGKEERDPNG